MKNFENYYGIKCIRNKNLPHREKGCEIETLYEDLREERVIKKYIIPFKISMELTEKFSELIKNTNDYGGGIGGFFNNDTINRVCKRFCGDRGILFILDDEDDVILYSLYSIQEDYIQLATFQDDYYFNKTKEQKYQHVSDITIDIYTKNIDDIMSNTYFNWIISNVNEISDKNKRLFKEHYKDAKSKTFEEIEDGFKEAVTKGFLNDIQYGENLIKEGAKEDVNSVKFNNLTLYDYSRQTALMLSYLILLKLIDHESHFESILPKTVKNRPTTFIDPKTGRINNGVIVVDKFYNTEIFVDHPFGVCGHWRNQYCGRDEFGNKKHKRIWIEAFEKSGYHRKSIKMKLEEELNKSE